MNDAEQILWELSVGYWETEYAEHLATLHPILVRSPRQVTAGLAGCLGLVLLSMTVMAAVVWSVVLLVQAVI